MSATLSSDQVALLQKEYMHSEQCLVLTKSVHRGNLKLTLRRYKRSKACIFEEEDTHAHASDDEGVDFKPTVSPWKSTLESLKPFIKDHSVVIYLDFVKDVEEVTELLKQESFTFEKYTGQMSVSDRQKA